MQMHRLKIYSFPYFADFTNDYKKSSFHIEGRSEYDPSDETIVFSLNYQIDNDYINKLISSKKVSVIAKISCKHFGFVKMIEFPFEHNSTKIAIKSLDIEGDIDIDAYLLTAEDIQINDETLSNDWKDLNPVVLKGNVIGESNTYVITVNHYHDGGKQSIVSFVEKVSLQDEDYYQVDLSGDRICINLPKKMYKQYCKVASKNEESIITDFLIPVFAKIFTQMKEIPNVDNQFNNDNCFKEWYKVLSNKYEKEFNLDPKEGKMDPLEAAQKLLKVTLRRVNAVSKDLDFIIKARDGGIKND